MDSYTDKLDLPPSRRINKDEGAKLKNLAGLIQGLTYREMNEFAEQVAGDCPNDGPDTIVQALLAFSDRILKK